MKADEALVLKSTGSWYQCQNQEGQTIDLRLKGKVRLKGLKSTNPIAVGDRIQFDAENQTIKKVLERKNYIIRRSNNLSKYSHIIAANIDQAYVICSFKEPRTSQGFIDRFLLTCEAYDIPAQLVMNKMDLLNDEELDMVAEFLAMYEEIGYPVHMVSVKDMVGIDEFSQSIKQQVSLFSGHSGVGKSSLINALIPGVELKVGDVSTYHYKGRHTTTFAEMHTLPNDGFIIDTPGIKDFGLVNMEREEISHYFPEMAERIAQCKFSNCLHVDEPQCAVREAAENGEIDFNRYHSYLTILREDDELNTPDYIWRKTLPDTW